jgi:hypothetical protein
MRILSFLVLAGTLYGQAAVEVGFGASRAATSTAPAAGIGKSIAGAFSSLDKTLKGGQSSDAVTTEVITVRSTLATQPKPSNKTYENIAKVEVGLEYDSLIQRFGPAALEVAGDGGVKKLTYPGKDGSTQVEVKEGKVSAVNLPKAQPGVMTLPK